MNILSSGAKSPNPEDADNPPVLGKSIRNATNGANATTKFNVFGIIFVLYNTQASCSDSPMLSLCTATTEYMTITYTHNSTYTAHTITISTIASHSAITPSIN